MKMFSTALYLALSGAASAHQGHGLSDSGHWHATDAWGLAVMATVLFSVLWWSRRK
ncbi:MAG: hypothetical protein OEM00_10085 [Burkholderiaceae bacterium]|nr:hypothetical protein [Burkholderiaceae bacterium]